MEKHFELNDDVFEEQFRSCVLEASLFNHEAHLRLAWIHIRRYGVEKAVENICEQLQNFVKSLGAADKYNHTLTVAAIRAVNHFYNKTEAENFETFILKNPRLKFNFRELIAAHYETDIFKSETAKRQWLEPELLAFT